MKIKQKSQVIIIVSCGSVVILLGLLATFFGSFIYNIDISKQVNEANNLVFNQLFGKWILMLIIFNLVIIAGYFSMFLQISMIKEGEEGVAGDRGPKGKDFKND